jgi:hypothetical protein
LEQKLRWLLTATEKNRTRAEIARLGRIAVERFVTPGLHPGDKGKFVAVDVDTGDFEMDPDDYTAVMRLRKRRPDGELFLARAGFPTAATIRSLR